MLVGCATGYEADVQRMEDAFAKARKQARMGTTFAERLRILNESSYSRKGLAIFDSLYQLGPSIRYHSDLLARADSAQWADILLKHVSRLYIDHDTLEAVYAYMDALNWYSALPEAYQVDHTRRLAETIGDAVDLTHSPNMARLSYQAFERAKRLALAHGDPHYIHLADSSYKAVARQVLTMPDSVRVAFGPAPERPARVPWVLATLAAAFIAVSVAGGCDRSTTTSPSRQ